MYIYVCEKKRERERHLDDLFCSEYAENSNGERRTRGKETQSQSERRGNFDKSLVSKPFCSYDMLVGKNSVDYD